MEQQRLEYTGIFGSPNRVDDDSNRPNAVFLGRGRASAVHPASVLRPRNERRGLMRRSGVCALAASPIQQDRSAVGAVA